MSAEGVVSKQIRGGTVVAKFHSGGYITRNSSNQTVAANTALENVLEMNITEVKYSIANGAYWTVKRGANTVLSLTGDGTMEFDADGYIDGMGGEAAANCVVSKTGTSPSTIVIKLKKRSAITGGSQY